jgi:protein-S-isoprenylcysteine O-methyltransferase Ste14
MLLALLAMAGLHYAIPLAQVVEPPVSYFGLVPLLIGLMMAGTAARLFDRAGTPKRPFERSTALVTAGPYRYTRNPMYVGLTLILLGAWLLLGTATAAVPIAIFVWIIQERFIAAKSGSSTRSSAKSIAATRAACGAGSSLGGLGGSDY